jgi:hypothetical protein
MAAQSSAVKDKVFVPLLDQFDARTSLTIASWAHARHAPEKHSRRVFRPGAPAHR